MIKVLITTESRYPVDRRKIKAAIESALKSRRINYSVEVSVLVCGTRKSKALAKKYLNDNKPHNVISFPMEDMHMLGDIVVCYPLAQEEANKDNVLVDTKINELVSHAIFHLLGEHHEE